jgi:hypothetical protein
MMLLPEVSVDLPLTSMADALMMSAFGMLCYSVDSSGFFTGRMILSFCEAIFCYYQSGMLITVHRKASIYPCHEPLK